MPPAPNTVIYFVSHLADRKISHKTIKLQHRGFIDNISDSFHLRQVLLGIKKTNSYKKRVRLPITINLLTSMEAKLPWILNPTDRVMLQAAMRLAFYGFLRSSEFCAPSDTHFDPLCHLTSGDVVFHLRQGKFHHLQVNIKQSKTDPCRSGQTIYIGATNNQFCPVSSLYSYLSLRPSSRAPLFTFLSGAYLTCASLVTHVHTLLSMNNIPHSLYNSHSFRSGARTTCSYMPQVVSDKTIQILGRWRSDSHKLYDTVSVQTCIDVTRNMSRMLPGESQLAGDWCV